MNKNNLSVREINEKDVESIADYWFNATPHELKAMGADPDKLPVRDAFTDMLYAQLPLPYAQKKAYGLIWEINGRASGHCNVNPFVYGDHAYMHLHLWQPVQRQRGFGAGLVGLSVPYFFENLKLKKLYCQPYALNEAPSRTLKKAGFIFVKEYTTTPGYINFEQPVKLWVKEL